MLVTTRGLGYLGLVAMGVAVPFEVAAQAPTPSAPPSPDSGAVDEIVVTGTRTPRLRRDSPVRTDVIGDTILRLAAPKNLADALEYLPGARAESNCQNCNTTEIQLLGLPGAYNQILFDGLPLLSGVAGVYGVEQIPALLIDRIEVVKGGASALYGPGAVAGVVNIIPRPIGQTGWRGALTYERPDGQDYYAASLFGTRAWNGGASGGTLYGHYEDAPTVDYNGDGYTELAQRELFVGGARSRIALTGQSTLLLDYQYTSEDRRGGNRLEQPSFLANISEEIDTRQHKASVSLQHRLSADTQVVGTYALVQTDRETFYGGLGEVETDPTAPGFDQAALDAAIAVSRNQYGTTDNTVHFAELRAETGLGRHSLIGGIQYEFERVDDRNIDVDGAFLSQLADADFDNLGVFAQDEWSLADNLRLVLGGRVDFSSEVDDPIVSPRIGLWWSPSEPLVIRANVSTGFRAPEVFSEDLHIDTLGAEPVRIRNVDGLTEEKSVSYALGFDWRPLWNDAAFTLDGQAYYATLQDTLFLGEIEEDADGTLFQTRSNAGGSTIAGAELTATYRASSRLQGSIGASYIDARYDAAQVVFDDGGVVLSTDRYLKSPRLGAVAQLVYQPTDSIQTFVAVRYVDRMEVLSNTRATLETTPSFVVVDLTATRHFPVGAGGGDVDVTLGVKNIFDERQDDLESGPNRDSDYVYGPRSPRTFFVRFDAHF